MNQEFQIKGAWCYPNKRFIASLIITKRIQKLRAMKGKIQVDDLLSGLLDTGRRLAF